MLKEVFLIAVNCDGLHPDDTEELKRLLETSRYGFKVEVSSKDNTEKYPELFVIGVNTTLLVRFSTNWMWGRTRRGGVNAVVNVVDETIDNSSHDRNRRPKVGVGPNGEPIITTEEASRGRKKPAWSRGDKVSLGAIVVAVIVGISAFFIPEVRQFLHLEKKPTVPQQAAHVEPPITLESLFKSDFPNVMKLTTNTDPIVFENGARVAVVAQEYMDFPSRSSFVGYYIPPTSLTFRTCVRLANSVNVLLDHFKHTYPMQTFDQGGDITSLDDIQFSGRVFIYHMWPMTLTQKATLVDYFKSKDLAVEFRSMDYLQQQVIARKAQQTKR
jgi:hypothetical protein